MRWTAPAAIASVLLVPSSLGAQTNLQVWANYTTDWVRSERLTYSLDFEPKVLAGVPEGEPGWRNLDISPSVEWSPKRWLDLNAEGTVGNTHQTDDLNTTEVTAKIGARFHLFSRHKPTLIRVRERPPRRRVVLRDLVRVEYRNFFYSDSTRASSSARFRNRLEFLAPLNKERLSDDGVRYVITDWEWFVPAGEPDERFANKQRIRVGLGYRRSFEWRYQVIYMWTRSRNTIEEGFKTSDNIIDFQVKRVF